MLILSTMIRRILVLTGKFISDVIDYFYPPFRRYFGLQFFRYGVSGAANIVFDWGLYSFIYNIVLQKQMLNLGIVTLSSPIAALFITFPKPTNTKRTKSNIDTSAQINQFPAR